jgi:GSH-dependent disulfide-bond oxidoreductase
MIDLYTWPVPNGHKVQIMLEETGLPYRVVPVNIARGAQFLPHYLALNPNNKVPTIVDLDGCGSTRPFAVFESGAILIYLAEKSGCLLPPEADRRSEVIQWLIWQMSGLGPVFGQAQYFHTYAPETVPHAVARFTREGQRLLGVMERRLQDRDFLCGDYSIADVACFPWIRVHRMANQSLFDFPNVRRWYGTIRMRPTIERALRVLREQWVDIGRSDEAKRHLFGPPQFRDR